MSFWPFLAVMALYQPTMAALILTVGLIVRFQWRVQVITLINTWIAGGPSFSEARYFAELGLGATQRARGSTFGLRQWITQRVQAAGIRRTDRSGDRAPPQDGTLTRRGWAGRVAHDQRGRQTIGTPYLVPMHQATRS